MDPAAYRLRRQLNDAGDVHKLPVAVSQQDAASTLHDGDTVKPAGEDFFQNGGY